MTFIITIATLSFVASAMVVSACALSSRLSQQERHEECYAESADLDLRPVESTTSFSVN